MIGWQDSPTGGAAWAVVGIGGEAVFSLYINEQADDDGEYPPWLWEIYIGDPSAHREFRYGRCASMEDAKRAAEAAVLGLLREMLATVEAT